MNQNQNPRRNVFRTAASAVAVTTLAFFARTAAAVETGLKETGDAAQLNTTKTDLAATVGGMIRSLLGFVGVIFVVLTIYAGFLWMTASGNEEQVTKAKNILKSSIIGMVIVFASYSIANFVINSVLTGTGVT